MKTKVLYGIVVFSLLGNLQAQDPRDPNDPRNQALPAPVLPTTEEAPEAEAPEESQEPQGIRGPLSGEELMIGRSNISGLMALEGGAPPPASHYQNGKIVVGDLVATASETGSESIYQIELFAPSSDETGLDQDMYSLGTFALTESQLRQFIGENAVNAMTFTIEDVRNSGVIADVDCDPLGGYPNEETYREAAYAQAQAPVNPPLPEERYERGTRSGGDPAPYYGGGSIDPALFATGRTTAVGDGTGLINRRENDPNANRETPGCEALGATAEEREENPDLEINQDNLQACIEGIQDFILQGVSQPPSASDRDLVFRRLFDLPNHEQEFAAAIFTVDGEAGHHARENPMEGIMVLKVLSNRRDNANGVEDELQDCRDRFSDLAERSACFGDVNENSTFNLLDVALDRFQFSMYNEGEGGNWTQKFGHKRPGQFDDAINSFLAYQGVEEFEIRGGNGNADIHRIYHYHTPAVSPAWRRDNLMLQISGQHETLGRLEPTDAHVFYFNHDLYGEASGDGWRRNVRHEFRDLP